MIDPLDLDRLEARANESLAVQASLNAADVLVSAAMDVSAHTVLALIAHARAHGGTNDLIERRASHEVKRLRRFLTRIASPDEITGDGATEEMAGPAAREMRARMAMAQRGLDGDEFP